jgi:catechol 2,3-dioxygenase-like lactoylglutathione lyase family enzyme
MLNISKVDHIGIRVREKRRAIGFYETLGFALISDTGFEQGHPVMMRHPSGIVLNLLGPSTEAADENILMDIDRKYAGYTHMALKVDSFEEAEVFLADNDIEITGRFGFKGMRALFIRDPDRNVIELDNYEGDDPETRMAAPDDDDHRQ